MDSVLEFSTEKEAMMRRLRYLPYAAVVVGLISGAAWPTTYHTITIDGTNDFAADEDVTGTSGSMWYFTWDASNFYFGIDASDVSSGDPNKWVHLYIDSDPMDPAMSGSGSVTGVNYNTQEPGLPFTANYHIRWKADNTFLDMLVYSGGWVGSGASLSAYQSGNYVEIRVSRSDLGSPSEIYVVGSMINETAFSEYTFFMTPDTNTEGYDADYAHWWFFVLEPGRSPDSDYPVDQLDVAEWEVY